MEIKEGYFKFLDGNTYYRIINDQYKKTPLIMLHGGPGSTHNSFEVLDDLSDKLKRTIVMYDQYGCGNSIPSIENKELYNKETWCNELELLIKHLNYNKVILFGHSWGGMLEIIYLCDYKPDYVEKVIISSSLSSAKLWEEETHRLLNYLNKENKDIINNPLKYQKEDLDKALNEYVEKYIKDIDNIKNSKIGKLSYLTAWGENEFSPSGNLKGYEYTNKLKNIKIPTLIISGIDDESTPLVNKTIYDNIASNDKKWCLIKGRHKTYTDNKEEFEECIINFLKE